MPATSPAFLESLICFLMPHFRGVIADADTLRSEIVETLGSYGTRSRAEMINAAQIIALGFTTLETLAESKTPEMSPSMRLRFRGCANNLNRSGQHTETTLAKRLANDVPGPTTPLHDPVNDVPNAAVDAALQQTQAEIDASRGRASPTGPSAAQPSPAQTVATTDPVVAHKIAAQLTAPARVIPTALAATATPGPRPDPGSREERNKRLWASAMTQVLTDMGMPFGSESTTAISKHASHPQQEFGPHGPGHRPATNTVPLASPVKPSITPP